MERKVAHLEMIQAVVTRMANNSFLLKGWSITLVAALFALAADKANVCFVYLAYFPVAMFWFLDGYFLRQERLFRKLYDQVRGLAEEDVDFSMNTAPLAPEVDDWLKTCFSSTLLTFHGTVFASVIVVMVVLATRP